MANTLPKNRHSYRDNKIPRHEQVEHCHWGTGFHLPTEEPQRCTTWYSYCHKYNVLPSRYNVNSEPSHHSRFLSCIDKERYKSPSWQTKGSLRHSHWYH
ncbi:Uncharacterised protein [Vibrio cholerae]|nr:Uncharacterised protein [Vibrio cholerae]